MGTSPQQAGFLLAAGDADHAEQRRCPAPGASALPGSRSARSPFVRERRRGQGLGQPQRDFRTERGGRDRVLPDLRDADAPMRQDGMSARPLRRRRAAQRLRVDVRRVVQQARVADQRVDAFGAQQQQRIGRASSTLTRTCGWRAVARPAGDSRAGVGLRPMLRLPDSPPCMRLSSRCSSVSSWRMQRALQHASAVSGQAASRRVPQSSSSRPARFPGPGCCG